MKLTKKGFYRLLSRYRQERVSPEEKAAIEQWFNSLHHEIADQPLGDKEEAIKARIWSKVEPADEVYTGLDSTDKRTKWARASYWKLAAACLILAAGWVFYTSYYRAGSGIVRVPDEAIQGLTEAANSGNQLKTVSLPDGSQVTLDPGSALFYPAEFAAGERKVYLKGDGFFRITPDKSRPFKVYSDHIVTEVVGTSFTIRKNFEKGSVEVAVLTGKVKVQENKERSLLRSPAREVVLTPNKKVTFYPETEKLVTGLVEQPKMVPDVKGENPPESFNYLHASLPVIAAQLEKAYGVRINIANESIRACTITADVSQYELLFDRLDILCAAIGAAYAVSGDEIVITGAGCTAGKRN